jgi:hypothetical protein
MIHQVILPKSTRKRLGEVVALQIWLLRYATESNLIDKNTCAAFLKRVPWIDGRESKIVGWAFNSKRYESLSQFGSGPPEFKVALLKRIILETRRFGNGRGLIKGLVIPESDREIPQEIQDSHNGARQFLLAFYDAFCDSGFPKYFFPGVHAKPFGRQVFLDAFVEMNNGLYVCAICDESGYFTAANENIYTDIDHYLPKSIYPHLSCHPYNMIPICHPCNSYIKGTKDLLEGPDGVHLRLEDILLPYRKESGLASRTYLQIGSGESAKRLVEFNELKPRGHLDLRHRIGALGRVYQIPMRWNERVDQIGETLFRRIYQFLQDSRGMPIDASLPQVLMDALDQLLYYLCEKDQGDLGKDPFAFAMTWWLAHLINEEIEPVAESHPGNPPGKSALLQEIEAWFIRSTEARYEQTQRMRIAQDLRGLVKISPQAPTSFSIDNASNITAGL